jgi:hypothetical protein
MSKQSKSNNTSGASSVPTSTSTSTAVANDASTLLNREPFLPPTYPTFEGFATELLSRCTKTTQAANELNDINYPYLLSTDTSFKHSMKSFGSRLVNLMQKFLDKETEDAPPLKSLELAEGTEHDDHPTTEGDGR